MNIELTTKEKLELGNLNALRMIEIGTLEDEKKKHNDELNKRIKAIQEDVIADSITLKNGYREVDPQLDLPIDGEGDEHWSDAESAEREPPAKPKKGRKKKAEKADKQAEAQAEAEGANVPVPQHDPEEEDGDEPLPTKPETPPKDGAWLDRKVFMKGEDGAPKWPELLVTGQIYDAQGDIEKVICTTTINGAEFRQTLALDKITTEAPSTTAGGSPINKASKVPAAADKPKKKGKARK